MKDNKSIKASHLTAQIDLDQIVPSESRIVIKLKSWPSQSVGGVIVAESYTVIRGEQYIAEVESVSKGCILCKEGDIITTSMYSGFHVATKTGHAKIIREEDILSIKSNEEMEKNTSFEPETFKPGINYILVKIDTTREIKTASGIVTTIDSQKTKNDAITKLAEVISIGPMNDYGKTFQAPKIGDDIIIDSFVGIPMNSGDINAEVEYRIMYVFDILGYVK